MSVGLILGQVMFSYIVLYKIQIASQKKKTGKY